MLRTRLLPLLAAAVFGLLQALSFAPWNLPWLQPLALAGLFALAWRAQTAPCAAGLGFAFGLGWFGLGVSWVYISMHRYGELPPWLAGPATAAFCAFLALYPALALGAARLLAPRGAHMRLLLALPAAWAGTEWLRGTLLTGFPWLASGYAHSDGPLAGYAPLVGVYGLTLAAAWIAAALAAWAAPGAGRRVQLAAGAVALALAAGGAALAPIAWSRPDGAPLRLRLLQGNLPQDTKFTDDGLTRAIDVYQALLAAPPADLVVLPESVYPLPLNMLPDPAVRQVLDAAQAGSAVIFGVFIEQPAGHYYNSAVGLDADRSQPPQRYSKRHLVPFGEFIPWGFRWFVDAMSMPIADQQRGAAYQAPMRLAGQRIAVNICYEDLFGTEIIAAWREPEAAPTLLLNLSNLAWFDDSIALDQHLQIARLRARETARPMLRATNTGATAAIDAQGRVVARLPYLTEGALETTLRGHVGDTPYVRFGDAPALAAIGLLLAAAALPALRARRRRPA